MKELGHKYEEENGCSAKEGPLNECFPESNFCTKSNGRENQNVCPEKELLSSAKTKSSRKNKGLNLRKSLAWNPAFFTEEGVLNPLELSKITGLVTKPSSRLPSKTNVESSSKTQFNKFSKRPPLKNLEENFLSKHQARPLSRSSTTKAPKLLPISEASSHDETQMPMALQKSSVKGIPKDVPKLSLASSSLEKGKRKAMHIEKDASTLKSNNCPLSTNRLHMELNRSASTRMIPSVIEKKHNFYGLPPAPVQAASRMPSPHEVVKKAITMKPQFEEGLDLLKSKSFTSSTTKSQMQTTCSGSSGIITSFSQQKFNGSRLPSPLIEAKPSGLRMPSPSLGLFQQKKITSSTSNQLHKTSQVPISGIPSLRKPTKLKNMALSKPSVAQTEQQASNDSEACRKNTEIKHIDMKGAISSNVCGVSNCLSDVANDIMSSLSEKDKKTQDVFLGKPYTAITKEIKHLDSEACTKTMEIKHIDMKGDISSNVCGVSNSLSDAANDFMSSLSKKDKKTQDVFLGKPYTAITKEIKHIDSEACTKNMEIIHIDMKGAISSNVCGVSNSLSDAANDIMSSLSKKDKKTHDVFLGKPYTAITKELPEEICSISQISSNSLSEGNGMIGSALLSNGFENTSGSITSEVCSTSFEMHFPHNLDEWNSKQLYVCAPIMNHDLTMHMDAEDEPDTSFADSSKEKFSSKLSDSVSNLRIPCTCISEKAVMHIEPKELPEVFDAQNSEEHLEKIKSQVQQPILSIIEEHANSSQDVQPVASEECQLQDNLQLCELRNGASFVKENSKKISLDCLKQDTVPLKHQLSSVPYSEEWLAAMENFGEDILEVKTGKVYNSPPDKAIPEPGPWSPVKRKSQDVGPFDCTKYSKKNQFHQRNDMLLMQHETDKQRDS